MTIPVVALIVLVVLGALVKVLDFPCWGVETYTLSVSDDLPNIATPLGANATPAAHPQEEVEAA